MSGEDGQTELFPELVSRLSNCTLCEKDHLIPQARPCFQLDESAQILIASQAPGRIAHETGLTFNDPSGVRLREWMGVTWDEFYNKQSVAIMPMGFCYPGKAKYGDLPPPKLCSETWHPTLLPLFEKRALTLSVGQYSQTWHLGKKRKKTLTATVENWREYLAEDGIFPMPHPSPLNNIWLKKNPWFEREVVPELQKQVRKLIL